MQIQSILTIKISKTDLSAKAKIFTPIENDLNSTVQRRFFKTGGDQNPATQPKHDERSLFDTSRPIYNSAAE
jgi:hypothetical protein